MDIGLICKCLLAPAFGEAQAAQVSGKAVTDVHGGGETPLSTMYLQTISDIRTRRRCAAAREAACGLRVPATACRRHGKGSSYGHIVCDRDTLLAAGTLMEDASVDAIGMMPDDRDALAVLTTRLRDAGYEIAVLTAAAHVLILRFDDAHVADEE